jgi:hypothetical protein
LSGNLFFFESIDMPHCGIIFKQLPHRLLANKIAMLGKQLSHHQQQTYARIDIIRIICEIPNLSSIIVLETNEVRYEG